MHRPAHMYSGVIVRVSLFIEYHYHEVMLIVRVIIRVNHCFGWLIGSHLTRFARVITGIRKHSPLEF